MKIVKIKIPEGKALQVQVHSGRLMRLVSVGNVVN